METSKKILGGMINDPKEDIGGSRRSTFHPVKEAQLSGVLPSVQDAAKAKEVELRKALAVETQRDENAEKDAEFFQGLIERAREDGAWEEAK